MAQVTPQESCVLIPAYNEAQRIGPVICGAQGAGFTVLVLDDGSTDETAAVASKAGARVLVSEKNEGKGACLRRGIEAFLKTDFKAVVLMDSDGQHASEDLSMLLAALDPGHIDMVIGNRMDRPTGMPWIRQATNRLMSAILSLACGQKIPDSQCGYRALTRRAVQTLSIQSDRFEVESEMILEASRHGLVIAAVPVRCVYGSEVSRIRPLRDTVRFVNFLFRYLLTKKSPDPKL